ncbi:sodium/myo-inositol cotransporter [Algibacter lectus]|uniref:Sodium/myo-inositol cotransporter n=1 Tax=Algibacter lectus TaxID=221126 RepID=A0A090WX02_9FLAO|nr:sodium/myo-inositol cotransporter [Algibacter lectus]
MVAPMVANAPDGLYQLLQQLNGIFFIPIASIMLAGFFLKNISAMGAKVALFVGLTFYILTTFIFKVDIHFVHIWGIEFVLNLIVMFAVSYFYPPTQEMQQDNIVFVEMKTWKYTKPMAIMLCVVTVAIYVLLGNAS